MTEYDAQQGDVLLYQTVDDGDIIVTDGITRMTGGLETAAYLALFGGNDDDNGVGDNLREWWGNISENDPAKKYRSQTQYLLRSIPAISANLLKIEEAAKADLAFFVTSGAATAVDAAAVIAGLNRVQITCTITAEGRETSFAFAENWRALI